jgi:hypothetical protein
VKVLTIAGDLIFGYLNLHCYQYHNPPPMNFQHTGPDGVDYRMFAKLGPEALTILTSRLNGILTTGEIPETWRFGETTLLHKKGPGW